MNSEFIRNFSIIAHINHGKSTLADRFLELTNTVPAEKMKPQFLDQMGLERERGITIKMQPVRMIYHSNRTIDYSPLTIDAQSLKVNGQKSLYILNLIDTPGHVDFSYEVSRALAAVEGTILLVDAQKGVQAQTLSHLRAAQALNLVIIPVVNKIDLPQARTEDVKKEIASLLNIAVEEIQEISAKTNQGVNNLLELVIKKVPPPKQSADSGTQALVFDSFYDQYKGVVAHVRLFSGQIKTKDKIIFIKSGFKAEVLETGVFGPQLITTPMLRLGEIGYIATGLKEIGAVKVGDTVTLASEAGQKRALPGYQEPRPVVFASFYPVQADDWDLLRLALAKLKLNDAALAFEPESSTVLGRGFKLGFLGLLHLEIIAERLRREFNLNLTTSTPSVAYEIELKGGAVKAIQNAALLPKEYELIREPWVFLEIVTPLTYFNAVNQLVLKHRGVLGETKTLGPDYLLLQAESPLAEIITGFYDALKSATSGFASLNWRFSEYRRADLVKLEILVAGEKVEGLTRIVHKAAAYNEGKRTVEKLKELLPAQQFAVSLQAVSDGRIIARETMRARRKDVTGYLYGGDRSRKDKLLKKQKEGKKKLQETGRVRIPAQVFLEILKP